MVRLPNMSSRAQCYIGKIEFSWTGIGVDDIILDITLDTLKPSIYRSETRLRIATAVLEIFDLERAPHTSGRKEIPEITQIFNKSLAGLSIGGSRLPQEMYPVSERPPRRVFSLP